MAPQEVTIDYLLNLVPDQPEKVITHLAHSSSLANAQDAAGYSLLHAAVSYSHSTLVTVLLKEYNVNVNIADSDGDVPLSVAEDEGIARILVEEHGADIHKVNNEGNAVLDVLEDNEVPLVVAYVRGVAQRGQDGVGSEPPPHMPNGVGEIKIGTMSDPSTEESLGEADPEIRRRIEELASREDFQSERGQEELRNLVQEVVSGLRDEQASGNAENSNKRQRTD